MTPYTKLQFHLERHAYKKGMFKGDAPADSSRRGKNHFRVTKQGHNMCVRMWNTNLITVTPDNHIRISMGGWWTSTTKQNLNEALSTFLGWGGGVGSRRLFNYTQMCFHVKGKTYKFYDGMEFDAEGNLLSPASCFERQCVDKEETKEFREDIAESGFKAVWPVLFATAEARRLLLLTPLRKAVTSDLHVNVWPEIAAHYKRHYDDHKQAYQAIVRQCTQNMTTIVKTDVTVI